MNVHSPLSCLAATLMAATALPAQRAVRPDRLVIEPPTLHCVSVQYHLRGDENENATCAVQYRRPGDSAWREAQPLLRVSRGENAQYKVSHGNMLAGSVFWLEPDTPYELRLTLRDPDGGGEERVVAVRTRGEPRAAADARQILVQPDTIAPALENARAGDVFVLQPGRYGSLRISRDGADGRPIVLRGANRDQVTIVGTLTLSERQHVILEDLDVQGHIVAHRGRDLAVKRCRIRVTERKPNIHGIGDCRNYYIADNELLGSGEWSNEQRAGSDGVKLSGSGHVICHNLIRDHWDNISLYTIDDQKKPGGFPCMAVDIYGNDFFGGRDDGIEADYQHHNIRIFRNRFTNTGSTISFQPMYGGPGYVLYNEIYNSRIKPYKFHVGPSGMIVYHNTSISSWNGWSGGNPDNLVVKNNLIFANPRFIAEGAGNVATEGTKVIADFNGYNVPAGGFSVSFSKGQTARSLAELRTWGFEAHGVVLDLGIFQRAEYPVPGRSFRESYGEPYAIGQFDLQLQPGSAAIDAGAILPNINDGYVGAAPDLGCHEVGRPPPHYGPRPVGHARAAGLTPPGR